MWHGVYRSLEICLAGWRRGSNGALNVQSRQKQVLMSANISHFATLLLVESPAACGHTCLDFWLEPLVNPLVLPGEMASQSSFEIFLEHFCWKPRIHVSHRHCFSEYIGCMETVLLSLYLHGHITLDEFGSWRSRSLANNLCAELLDLVEQGHTTDDPSLGDIILQPEYLNAVMFLSYLSEYQPKTPAGSLRGYWYFNELWKTVNDSLLIGCV